MSTLLVQHATKLVTMDDQRREISDGGLFIRDGFIEAVGLTSELPQEADEVIDLSGHIVLPGLVNIATIILSKSFSPLSIISRWPLVTGSNEPG